jgi:proteic killer suppression protein
MIKSFRHKGLKAFFETGNKRGISPGLAARIGRRLDVLNAALRPDDIDVHGFALHRLKGERGGVVYFGQRQLANNFSIRKG